MRVKVRETGKGLHHSEIIVEIKTAGATEKLVIPKRSVENGSIQVGAPVAAKNNGQVLVELPRETMSGASRIWVKLSELIKDQTQVRAA